MSIETNLNLIEERIAEACMRSGRRREDLTLIGVSKKQPVGSIRAALEMTTLRDFGENYVQEYVTKREQLSKEIADYGAKFHFIGHLQRNKVRQLMSQPPAMIHSVDSPELVLQINKVSTEVALEARQKIVVELRIGDEDSEKTGLSPECLPNMIETIDDCRQLHWVGLMIIPPLGRCAEDSRPYFREVRGLFDKINSRRTEKLTVLSYGMSDDFEVAIEEGATHLRIGTAIFGARKS